LLKYDPIPLEEIRAAQKRISSDIVRTPLVRFDVEGAPADVYLKLENLQPVRAFKIRPASNALRSIDPEQLNRGVWTVSSGNMAQGLAWMAKKLGVRCSIVLSTEVEQTKLEKILHLGANITRLPPDKYLKTYLTRTCEGVEGTFVHPFSDPVVIAGDATIGLEIIEDLPSVDAVVVPWGGGGLTCGIASAMRAVKPDVKIYAVQIERNRGQFASAFKSKMTITDPFSHMVFPEMFDLALKLIDDVLTVSEKETAQAIRLMAERNSVVAEGRGAVAVAAALSGKAGRGKIACIVSGGNIDLETLAKVFEGQTPTLWE